MKDFSGFIERCVDTVTELRLIKNKYSELEDLVNETLPRSNYHKNYKSLFTFDWYISGVKSHIYKIAFEINEDESKEIPLSKFLSDLHTLPNGDEALINLFYIYMADATIPNITLHGDEGEYLYKVWGYNHNDDFRYDKIIYTNDRKEFENAIKYQHGYHSIFYFNDTRDPRVVGFVMNEEFNLTTKVH